MATEAEQLVVALEARITQFEKAFARASRTADNQFSAVERRARQSADRLDNLMSTSALSVNRALGAIGLGISFEGIRRYADAWTEAGNKVKAAASATGVQVRSLDDLKAGANDARTSLEAYVDLYSRLTRSAAGVAKTEGEIATATNIVAKAFKAGGASASEQAAGILQLGQALGSGVLQGDELRSLRENAPILAQAIADAFGVPISALKALGEQGKLTSDKVFAAILAAGPKVEAQFKATTATIGDSFTKLGNEFTAYVGKIAEASGVSAAFRAVIDGLSNNIGAVSNAAAAAAAILLGSYVPGMIRAGAATAAMVATNPFLLIATAAVAAAFALTAFGDQLHPISGDLATVQDYASVAWDEIKSGAIVAADTIANAFQAVVDFTSNALSSIGTSWADVGAVIKGVANLIINSMVTAYDLVVATWTKLPGAIAESVIASMNGMITRIENALNAVIGLVNEAVAAINSVGSAVGVELGTIGSVTLGRIENAYAGAGEAAGKAYADALSNMTRDRVGEALAAINKAGTDALEAWRRRANEAAAQRKAAEDAAKTSADTSKTAPITGGRQTMPLELSKGYTDLTQRIAALQAELALRRSITGSVEQVEAALERQKVAQQLATEAIREGVVMTDDVRSKIGALADAYSRAEAAAKALAKSQQEAEQKAQDLAETGKSVFKGFVSDLAHGKSASDALASALGKIGEKFLDLALDQMWQGMMDNGGKGLFAEASAFLNPTTTKPQYAPGNPLAGVNFNPAGITTPTATVNAGTVTVNGGTPTLPGSPTTPTSATPVNTVEAAATGKPVVAPLSPAALPTENAASLAALLKGAIPANAYDKSIPASIRTNNPGAMWFAEWQKKYGVLGKQNLADGLGQGNNIGMFPTPEAGAAAQFELLQRYGAKGWDLRKAITTWSGGNSSDQYVNSVAGKLGMSPDAKIGALMGDQTSATRLAQYMAQQEAGKVYPMSKQQWGNAWQLYQQQSGQNPADLAQQQAQQAEQLAQQQAEAAQRAAQAQQQLAQQTAQLDMTATGTVPQLGGLGQGIGGLATQAMSAIPGLGKFGGMIGNVVQQLLSSLGGGGGGGGLFSLLGFADGGHVSGPGSGTSDSIPAMLSNGEFVVNAKATAANRPVLEAINAGKAPKFATGGIVSRSAFSSTTNNNINVSAASTGNARQDQAFANMLAGKIAAATAPKADTFRRSEGQQQAAAAAQLQTAGARNN
jgi:tape measure domain-containing protein